MCWCIVDAVLSAVAFGYTVKVGLNGLKAHSNDVAWLLQVLWVVSLSGCAVWSGVSHSLRTSKVKAAVGSIKAANARESSSFPRHGPVASLDLGGVDLFEYHDITSMSWNMSKLASVPVLLYGVGVVPLLISLIVGMFTCTEWAFFSCNAHSSFYVPLTVMLSALLLGFVGRMLYTSGVVGDIVSTFGEALPNQAVFDHILHVWTLVLVGGFLYNACMFFSPSPSMWRWGTILTHTARTLKVLYSLPWSSSRNTF